MGNQNSGRRPQPTALKVLRGNPSKTPLNQNEPVPPDGDVAKPSGLSVGASAVWDELAPICLAMRTLTAADVRVFSTMCELQATLSQASEMKGQDGREWFTTKREKPNDDQSDYIVVVDAVLKLERDTAVALRPFYALFGLEPVSRARIRVPKDEAPKSKWAGVLS